MVAETDAAISESDDDRIDLVALWRVTWRYKYLILLMCLLSGGVAAILGLIRTPTFRAEVVLSEVRDRGMASGLVSQFGGLATLAGINVGGAAGSEAQAVLKSRRLIEEFIQRNGLLEELGRDSTGKPTLWRAVKKFKERVVAIRDDRANGLTTVSMDSEDPITAARWANDFVALANELVRARALTNAKRNIAYLDEQIAKTNDVELRRVIYDLMESEAKTLMLANARVEYAFAVVDPAVAPEVRISPQRTLMVLLGLLVGGLLGIAIAFLHNLSTRSRLASAAR